MSTYSLISEQRGEPEDDKVKLRAIVETTVLCSRQDLALRGDKGSGRIFLEETLQNDGSFMTLLRYEANRRDTILANHMRAQQAAMFSASARTFKIINFSIIGKFIPDKIVKHVNEAGFF